MTEEYFRNRYKAVLANIRKFDFDNLKAQLQVGFNRSPYLLLRSYKRHQEKKSKIEQKRSSMQQADYEIMSSAHSMNAGKCVHAQRPYPSQAFAHESSKVRGRGKKRGRDTGKTEVRRLMEIKAAQQNKKHI